MTPDQRQELEFLQSEQRRLMRTVESLSARMQRLVDAVDREAADEEPASALDRAVEAPIHAPVLPPPLPPEGAPMATPSPPFAAKESLPPPLAPAPAPPVAAEAKRESLEIQLGTVWLARIGIVILVTGLVFLGNYARQFIVAHLGPGGKVALLLLAAGLLGGIGAWLERRRAETKRFAQVLIAGGAAMLYYRTYAVHFVRPLRVIESPPVAGVLLLAVGAAFIWWADRRRLETAALLGIGLSYYTAAINPIGDFTLYSSLLLTAATGFLLVRNGWALVSWLALLGTYGSYFWYRLGVQEHFHGLRAEQPWSVEILLLAADWALFTAPIFLAQLEKFPATRRASFLTLNNACFFALATMHIVESRPGSLWLFSLCFGGVLLALAALAWRRRAEDHALDSAYLIQGLAAVTAGLALKLTGPSLAIALAVESVVLLTNAKRRHGWIYRWAATSLGVWSFVLTWDRIGDSPELMLPLGGTVAGLFLLAAWWFKERMGLLCPMPFARKQNASHPPSAAPSWPEATPELVEALRKALRQPPGAIWSWRAAAFVAMSLVLIGNILPQQVYSPWEPAAFAIGALLATASLYLLRLPELTLLGQLYLLVAVLLWLGSGDTGARPEPWWNPLPVIGASLALAHWWQRQRILPLELLRTALQFFAAAALVAVGYFWVRRCFQGDAWLLAITLAGVGTLFYGYLTRTNAIAILGQAFIAAAVFAYVGHLGPNHYRWSIALLPIAGVAASLIAFAQSSELTTFSTRRGFCWLCPETVALPYWILTCFLTVSWVFEYLPREWQLVTFAIIGAALIYWRSSGLNTARRYTGLAFFALVFVTFAFRWWHAPAWQEMIALLLIPATLRRARPAPVDEPVQASPFTSIYTGLAVAGAWLWVTRWMHMQGLGHMLTIAWSALAVAVFIAGLTLRDRVYRLGGFAILAVAIGRIFLVDVWRLETIYRILSFLVLGVVLLLLGFVYNRFADQIRRWL